MKNGLPMRREYCSSCLVKISNLNLPEVSDTNVTPQTFKYKNKTLGEIAVHDMDFIKWIAEESKQPDIIKNAAKRLLIGKGWIRHKDGEPYPYDERYETYLRAINKLKNYPQG